MIPPKILLTSFQTWLPHQKSNSSDDLLAYLQQQDYTDYQISFLRQLPVHIDQATNHTIKAIDNFKPDTIICCGMAESRQKLTLESQAIWNDTVIKTKVNLEQLISQLSFTHISHDAGKFVCEGLYYQVLKYLEQKQISSLCLFVHVPISNDGNYLNIINDFQIILKHTTSSYN